METVLNGKWKVANDLKDAGMEEFQITNCEKGIGKDDHYYAFYALENGGVGLTITWGKDAYLVLSIFRKKKNPVPPEIAIMEASAREVIERPYKVLTEALVEVPEDVLTQRIVAAFSRIVDYKPFCRYIDDINGLLTFEWDKVDPNGRFAELQANGKLRLQKLNANAEIAE